MPGPASAPLMRAWPLAVLAVLAFLALAPAVAAKGILEDEATYPPGVTAVTRTHVAPGEDFTVHVSHDGSYTQAALAVCRFDRFADEVPEVCWSQVGAQAVDGAFVADSSKGAHPKWSEGWVIGYKLTLEGAAGDASVPATGGEYYKVVVAPLGEEAGDVQAQQYSSKAAPFCALCLMAIGVAVVAKRRSLS